MFFHHESPPSLYLDYFIGFILLLNLFSCGEKDVILFNFYLFIKFFSFVLHDELTIWILIVADFPEGVEESFGWMVVVDQIELITENEVLFLWDFDLAGRRIEIFKGVCEFGVVFWGY